MLAVWAARVGGALFGFTFSTLGRWFGLGDDDNRGASTLVLVLVGVVGGVLIGRRVLR